MPQAIFIFPAKKPRDERLDKLIRFIHKLPENVPWQVSIDRYKKMRSNGQNAYLFGVVYPKILEAGGEALAGWDKDDLHTFFCGEYFGWETIEGFGRKRIKPVRRTTSPDTLGTTEFMDFVAFIQQKCAELGIYIPDPNEEMQ
jgi:hypothetical protein